MHASRDPSPVRWWLVAPLRLCLALVHACAIAPFADAADDFLTHADEAAHALVREAFLVLARGVNGFSKWALSTFDSTARERLEKWDKDEHQWWQDTTHSTFNDIVAICDPPGAQNGLPASPHHMQRHLDTPTRRAPSPTNSRS